MILNIFPYGLEYQYLLNKLISSSLKENLHNNLILIHNGVYFGSELTRTNIPNNMLIYSLKYDLIARKILDQMLRVDFIKVIDYEEFVDLTLSHQKIISW